MEILNAKITDKRFLRLVRTLIQTPSLVDGKAVLNTIGCPQGLIISPCLSNIYLHHVIDNWFNEIRKTHLEGGAEMVRFADDMVFVFQRKETAEKFHKVLPKRLEKFGLKLHADKSSVIRTGDQVAKEAARDGKRIPVYKFLGFTCYWGKCRSQDRWRLKFKSRGDRCRSKLNGLRKYLKENLVQPARVVFIKVMQMLKGWINYNAISDNKMRVRSFKHTVKKELFRWLNRKGGKKKVNWTKFARILKNYKYPERFTTKSMFATC